MNKPDDQLTDRARQHFDESVEALDAATLSRLNRGRQAALANAGRRRSRWVLWAPLSGVAAAALVAAVLLQLPQADVPEIAVAADLDILLGEESIDMLEDLEFYAWLDTADLDTDDIG